MIIDAIGTDVSMPATSEKVWKALKKKGQKKPEPYLRKNFILKSQQITKKEVK